MFFKLSEKQPVLLSKQPIVLYLGVFRKVENCFWWLTCCQTRGGKTGRAARAGPQLAPKNAGRVPFSDSPTHLSPPRITCGPCRLTTGWGGLTRQPAYEVLCALGVRMCWADAVGAFFFFPKSHSIETLKYTCDRLPLRSERHLPPFYSSSTNTFLPSSTASRYHSSSTNMFPPSSTANRCHSSSRFLLSTANTTILRPSSSTANTTICDCRPPPPSSSRFYPFLLNLPPLQPPFLLMIFFPLPFFAVLGFSNSRFVEQQLVCICYYSIGFVGDNFLFWGNFYILHHVGYVAFFFLCLWLCLDRFLCLCY